MQTSLIDQIAIHRPQGVCNTVPAQGEVADQECQNYDPPTLVEPSERRAIKGCYQKNAEQNMTPSTPSIGHVYALASKLEDVFAEGLEARYARHNARAVPYRRRSVRVGTREICVP